MSEIDRGNRPWNEQDERSPMLSRQHIALSIGCARENIQAAEPGGVHTSIRQCSKGKSWTRL